MKHTNLVCAESVDAFHTWPEDNPHWTETFWFGAWVPEARLTVYLYQWFRPVLGIYGGGCLIWDERHWLPWDLPMFHYDVNRPIAGPLDLRDLQLDNGLSLRALEEGRVYELDYRRGDTEVSMRFASDLPPEITDNEGTSEFFAGHLDQAGHYSGHVRFEGREHRFDCHGIRDRSWGPRVISDDIRLGYCHGQGADLAFLAYSKPEGERVFKGYVERAGKREAVVGGQRQVQFVEGRLQRIELTLLTASGDSVRGVGVPLNRFAYMPYPNLLTWLYLMRWEIAGQVIYGEEQDAWSLPLWRRHVLAGGWP